MTDKKKEEKKEESKIKKLGIIIFLSVFIPIIVYVLKFHSFSLIKSTPSDWSSFATYVSGMLMPLLTIINIFVLFQLTKSAKEIEKNNVRTQLKFTTYNEIKNDFNKFHKLWLDEVKNGTNNIGTKLSREIDEIKIAFIAFCSNNSYLFENIDESSEYQNLLEAFEELSQKDEISSFIKAKEDFLTLIQNKYLK